MTEDRQPADWPDDRLADAFRARAGAHPTPIDLSAATIDRIRRLPTATSPRRRFAYIGGLAAAAAVFAVVVIALVARPLTDRTADEGSTFGLPVLSVSEAIAIRDSGIDDREIAVHGFYATVGAMRCPPPPIRADLKNPTRLLCEAAFAWLMEKPESIVSRTSTSMSARPPQGPALKPGLALVDGTAFVGDPDVPTAAVFIGHFDDRRADLCMADVGSQCADTFMVDRIDRGTLLTDTVRGGPGQAAQSAQTSREIDALISRIDPSLRVLSRRFVAIEDLGSTEPVYAVTSGDTPSYVSNAAWIVTALPPVDGNGRATARTFVVFDGTDFVSEITRSGIVDLTLSAAASPSPSSTAFGLSIVSVSEAVAVHDADPSDREIAVRGYFSPADLGRRCGFWIAINPVRLDCPFDTQWLLDTPQPLDGFRTSLPPGRSGFQPLLPGLDTSVLTEAADRELTAGSLVEVVLIGHFHDRRGHGALCDAADASACEGFVADGIYSVGGDLIRTNSHIEVPANGNGQVPPMWTAEDVDRLILEAAPGLQILSRVALVGSQIPTLEPGLGTGALGIIDRPFVWLVTGLDPGIDGKQPIRRTFLLVDGTAEAYESAPWDVSNVGFVPFHLSGLPLATDETSTSPPIAPPRPTDSTVIGKPVTVSEAIDHRDHHLDDTEILVRGYGWGPPGPIACTPILVAPPALDQCPDGFSWIGERKPVGTGPEFLQPDGPAFNLLVRQWTYLGATLGKRPRQILALGHFDDPRAVRCAQELVERCRRNFIVDAILDPALGWPADNASAPSLSCVDGLPIPDCAASGGAVLEWLTSNEGIPTDIEVGRGVWCPMPGLLFGSTSCPAGGQPPADGGQWIAHALVTFRDSPAQDYLNVSRSSSVVRATSIAVATRAPSPN